MPGPDDPLDPAATDQLAAAMGPPPIDPALAGPPPPETAPWSWIPPSWSAPPSAAPPLPPSASAPPDAGLAMQPPPVDASLAGPPSLEQAVAIPPPGPAAPGPPPVDAITGAGPGGTPADIGGPQTLTPAQREAAVAQRFSQHPDQLLAQLVGGQIDPDAQRYLDQLALRDPQGFAEINYRLADAKLKHGIAEQQRIAGEDFEWQKANQVMRDRAIAEAKAKSAQLDAEATRIAQTKIGPHQNMFQKVAGVLAAVVGGLYQGRTGSARNPGLDALNEVINRDMESQRAELSNQRDALGAHRSALAEQYARSGDLYRASEETRLAALKHADEQLATQQQNFAPDGTRGMQIAQLRAGIAAQQATSIRDFEQKQFDNSIKVQGAAREQQLASETLRHNRVSEGIDWSKLDIERIKAAKEGAAMTPDVLRAVMTQPGQPSPPIPPIAMSLKDYGSWLESTKKGQEAALGGREYSVGDVRPVRDADGNITGTENRPLTNKSGQLFQAPSTDEAKKLRNQMAGINSANQLIDEMVNGIKKYGGSSEFFKSPEWQTMQANKESVLFALHQAYGVEGFRPGVLEQMEHALGGQDPTKITVLSTNAIPGFEAAKRALNTHFNANLRSLGYTGEEYSPPDVTPAPDVPKLADRTLAESQPGVLDQVGQDLRTSFGNLLAPAAPTPAPGTAAAETGPPAGPTGLSVRDTASVGEMVRKYKAGTPATRERVLAELTAAMGADRPSLRAGILGLVDGESPELYDTLVKTLPRDERQALERQRAATAATAAQLPQAIVPVELLRGAPARQE